MRGWAMRPGKGMWRGAGGLRAGWRFAVYALLLAGFTVCEAQALARFNPPWLRPTALLTPGFVVMNELVLLVPVLAASWLMLRLEGRALLSCGLTDQRPMRHLAAGLAAGLAALSALMALLLAGGYAAIGWQGLAAAQIVANGLSWLAVSLLVGLAEELAFRGYPQQALSAGLGFWRAGFITSLLFACAHITNPHESVIGIINVFGAGLILCLGLWRTGSLWWPIGYHGGWDFTENFLFGTHDSGQACAGAMLNSLPKGAVWLSGGLAGPEGSLIGLGVEFAAALLVFRFLRSPAS